MQQKFSAEVCLFLEVRANNLDKVMADTNQLPLASNCVHAAAQESINANGGFDLPKNRFGGLAPQFVFRFAPFGVESSPHTLT